MLRVITGDAVLKLPLKTHSCPKTTLWRPFAQAFYLPTERLMVVSASCLTIDTPVQQCIMRTYGSLTNWTYGEILYGSARSRTQFGWSRVDSVRIGLSGAPKLRISTEPDLHQAGAGRTKSKWDGTEHAAEQHGAGPSWAGAGRTESSRSGAHKRCGSARNQSYKS